MKSTTLIALCIVGIITISLIILSVYTYIRVKRKKTILSKVQRLRDSIEIMYTEGIENKVLYNYYIDRLSEYNVLQKKEVEKLKSTKSEVLQSNTHSEDSIYMSLLHIIKDEM